MYLIVYIILLIKFHDYSRKFTRSGMNKSNDKKRKTPEDDNFEVGTGNVPTFIHKLYEILSVIYIQNYLPNIVRYIYICVYIGQSLE